MFRVHACLRMRGSLQSRRLARAYWSRWAILTVRLSAETSLSRLLEESPRSCRFHSADIVAGYGQTTKEVLMTVKAILKTGAVGINIEDFAHATKKLFPIERQIENVKAIRKLGMTSGVPIVINARTDAFRYAEGDDDVRFKEAIRRATAYRDAGADCVYPMGLTDPASIAAFVLALDFPVNVMVRKGLPEISELQRLGVARVSLGPSASYAAMGLLKRAAKELLEKGTYENLVEGAITFDELNALAVPRAWGSENR